MPKLISKIEGKGNGIKTVVPNMTDIARSLSRPPTYPTKFFGCELGAQVKCDEKNDRYIVNGAHDAAKLQELLDVFIKKFVLCAGCSNPETDLIITGKSASTQKIIRDCKACGQRTDVDMRHKLVTYILKNPPTSPKGKGGKKEKKGKKSAEDENPPSPTKGGSEDGSEDEITRRIQADASELPTADQNADDDDDWAVDTSADAVKKRIKALEEDVRTSLVITDVDDNAEENDPYEQMDEWLEENPSSSNNDIYRKIKELGISKDADKIIKHLLFGLFAENFHKSAVISKQIHKRAKLFKKFITNPDDQRALLGATEEVIKDNKELMDGKVICHILMEYYQNDLLDEEVFTVWIEGSASEKYQELFKRTGSIDYVDPAINQDIQYGNPVYFVYSSASDYEI
ncbi:12909_t:CDS:2 [Acaulospora colombiana]|uniref:12909_t:CDS:1 n=1 Tax=Acaulospora colombiana TaxID=27376 RepID=A0ACA9KBY1_9GLOM|nr:12909_t:CDS:2 [Acaulospora colombiana]